MVDSDREPCPFRILDDTGGAFVMGAIGGAIWHGVKGARNAPKGHRIKDAFGAVRLRSTVLGGNFAVWGFMFSVFDCTFAAVRRREDPWNAIMAGAATGGALAARAGWKAMGKNALIGGVLLAMIEGLGIMMMKLSAKAQNEQRSGAGIRIDDLSPPIGPPIGNFSSMGSDSSSEHLA